jgi:hypothetical protein
MWIGQRDFDSFGIHILEQIEHGGQFWKLMELSHDIGDELTKNKLNIMIVLMIYNQMPTSNKLKSEKRH